MRTHGSRIARAFAGGVLSMAVTSVSCNSTTSYPQNRTLNFRLDSLDSLSVPGVQQVTDSAGALTGDSVTISSGAPVLRPDSVFLIMHAVYQGTTSTSFDINERFAYTQRDNGDIVVEPASGAPAFTLVNVTGDLAIAQRRMAIDQSVSGGAGTRYWGGKFVFSFINAPPGPV